MKAANLFASVVITLSIVLGSGCSTTLVESLPVGRNTVCDAAWPGSWKAVEHGVGKAAPSELVQINADCTQLTFTDPEKTQVEKHTLTLVSTRAGDFLTIRSPGDKPDCVGEGNTHCGTQLIRYLRTGDEIDLFQPDHRAVHEALESHLVSGYTEMSIDPQTTATNGTQSGQPSVPPGLIEARMAAQDDKKSPTYRNLISGDPDQIVSILKQHPEFFSQEPWLILRRVGPMNAGSQP